MKYIIFDLETTCLQPEKAEIWQMAVKKVTLFDKTGEVENRVYKYKTVNPISFAARVRCNMTPEEIANYNDFNLQEVLDVLELDNPDVYYVGHNVSFDRGILQGIIERNNMSGEYIDKSKLPNLYVPYLPASSGSNVNINPSQFISNNCLYCLGVPVPNKATPCLPQPLKLHKLNGPSTTNT